MRRKYILERMTQAAAMVGEPLLRQPLLELCGEHRVLIEHHKGVSQYGQDKITVRVRYGSLVIRGTGLELGSMTKEQLVITGRIDAIMVCRGKC